MSDKPNKARNRSHPVEWVVGLTSTVLVAALIASVAYQAASYSSLPPRLTVKRIDAPTADHQVRFEIRNHADRTAASVLVHGEARKPDGSAEVAETTFDYVPGRSRTTGALIFSTDVTDADVTIRPAGYMDP
ncbi:uncharacterized protein (TIGR02588 family) [Rhizobium sp. BK512]|uniref:hypothetical protein n=1 Tax=Rhizobium sp. BK512 TaxID=2587010 RepID=UPI000DE0362F|nr:hypothetical protein [Rhizobium sp. BK512]MBB3564529.1 uncharacterized protein (TIGR02588 family) [Rhizobium sp. BK512]